MHRPLGAIVTIACLLLASPASAQQGGLNAQIFRITGGFGTRTDTEVNDGVNAVDCADAAAVGVEFSVAQLPQVGDNFDLWTTEGTTDCSATAARSPDTRTCDHLVGIDPDSFGENNTFEVSLADLTAGTDACASTQNSGTQLRIYVFDSGQTETTGDIEATWSWDFVDLRVDPNPPEPVEITSETSVSGNTSVNINWDPPTDNDADQFNYGVYLVGSCGGSGGDGGTSGGFPSGDPVKTSGTGATSVQVNPESDLGLADGGSAAVAIAAEDRAGNIGELSETICITRVPTAGFCSVFGGMEGEEGCPDGCSTITPGRSRSSASVLVLLLLSPLGLVLLRRTRRKEG